MFFNIIPFVLIIACLVGVMVIVVRKFPQLTSLDVGTLPKVQQAEVKKQLELKRFWRAMAHAGVWLKIASGPVKVVCKAGQNRFRAYVARLQEKYEKVAEEVEAKKVSVKSVSNSAPVAPASAVALGKIEEWLSRAEEHIDRNELKEAEQCFIESLKLDEKNVEAYRGLGKVYLDLERYKEAIAIFKFLLKLAPQDDRAFNRLAMAYMGQNKYEDAVKALEKAVEINDGLAIRFFDLGRLYQELERPAAALRNFQKASDIEPGNPKYLDQLLEISIITGDRRLAEEAYERLEAVNPDNQKLPAFRERIEEMG
ncbi:MAG: tetratricopeptide repeat protein [Candidatus Magasanikbacteria bacterium]|nr:tetratricopeptide repeat protein [Candidatus Magasanikbacteria bacterium]